jgi:peroxiredoxin Q/BCP
MTIEVGDTAPAFTRTAHNGESVRIGPGAERVTVLYFYPKDETAGCTAQACSFRDAYEDFVSAGASVVGVSGDSASSHESFAAHHRLPFLLLTDDDGALRRLYGVKRTLGLLPGRVTFVIDREGIVRHVFDSQLRTGAHVQEALIAVRKFS